MTNDRITPVLTPAMRADIERQPQMTQAEAEAAWLRFQMGVVATEPELAEALWGAAAQSV